MAETYIGKVEPWEARPALFTPGEDRWYALRCAPLREEAATRWLKEEGISSFFPVRVHNVTVRGKPMARRTLFLPGFVFARVPGEPFWHRLYDRGHGRPLIIGVLSSASGVPGRIQEADLRELKALAARDKEAEEAERERLAVKVGDVVRIPLLGDDAREVVELTARGGIKVRLTLLGRDSLVEVRDWYEKVLDNGALNPLG